MNQYNPYIIIKKNSSYQVIRYDYDQCNFTYTLMQYKSLKKKLLSEKNPVIENPYNDKVIRNLEMLVKNGTKIL